MLLSDHPVNRNGLIGDFDRFLPIKVSMDDLIKLAIENRGKPRVRPDEGTGCEIVAKAGSSNLVRYRLGSDLLRHDADELQDKLSLTSVDAPRMTAIFGLIEPGSNQASALIVAHLESAGVPRISSVITRDNPPSQADLLAALQAIDVPAAYNLGADFMLADKFDLWFDRAAGDWERREPVHLVSVRIERVCFSTRPVLKESVDVFLLHDDEHLLDQGDEDAVYWAKQHYRDAAFERLQELPNGQAVRPGFSSWMANGDPVLVKVIGDSLAAEIEKLNEARVAAPAP